MLPCVCVCVYTYPYLYLHLILYLSSNLYSGHYFCCRPTCASHTVDVCPSCRAPVKSRTVLFGAHAPTSQYLQIANLLEALARSASQPPI